MREKGGKLMRILTEKLITMILKGRSLVTVYRKEEIKKFPKGRSSVTVLIFKVLHMVTELRPSKYLSIILFYKRCQP